MKSETDVLVIEDEEVILNALKKIIEFENLTADLCINVETAIPKLIQNKYKLIISDIMMPGKSGFDLLSYVNQKRISTPVIITTGYSTFDNAVKALYEGAIGFIPKPFTYEELESLISRGLKYGELLDNKFDMNKQNLISYVSCPSKYYRLGFDSWMNQTGEGLVNVGVTDLFIKSIGVIETLDLLIIDEAIFQGQVCAKITDNNELIHQLLAPISGKIIEINKNIINNKSLLEKDPYFNGWIYKMIPTSIENDIKNIIPCSSDI